MTNLLPNDKIYFLTRVDFRTKHTHHFRAAANWLLGPVLSFLNEHKINISDFLLEEKKLAEVINLVDKSVISHTAAQRLLLALIDAPNEEPLLMAEKMNLLINTDEKDLQIVVEKAISNFTQKVVEYKKGRTGLLSLFVGEAMKLSKGKADPVLLQKLVKNTLDKMT